MYQCPHPVSSDIMLITPEEEKSESSFMKHKTNICSPHFATKLKENSRNNHRTAYSR
jgi:hypothetical protein